MKVIERVYLLLALGTLICIFHLCAFGPMQSLALSAFFALTFLWLWKLFRETAGFNPYRIEIGFRADRILIDMGLDSSLLDEGNLWSFSFVALNPKLLVRLDELHYGRRMQLWVPLKQAEVPWSDKSNFLEKHAFFYMRHNGGLYELGLKVVGEWWSTHKSDLHPDLKNAVIDDGYVVLGSAPDDFFSINFPRNWRKIAIARHWSVSDASDGDGLVLYNRYLGIQRRSM